MAYHASHKLLFLAYNQRRFRLCGKITASHERLPIKEVFHNYEQKLEQILQKPFLIKAMINTLYHALGGYPKTSPPGKSALLSIRLKSIETNRFLCRS